MAETSHESGKKDAATLARIKTWCVVAFVAGTVVIVALPLILTKLTSLSSGKSAPPSDLSLELFNIHRAATRAGIVQVRDNDPVVIGGWLAERDSGLSRVPDLAPLGMSVTGARMLQVGGNPWSMILYQDLEGGQADLVVIAAHSGQAVMPAEVKPMEQDGRTLWLDRVKGVNIIYFGAARTDWMLVSTRDQDFMLSAAGRLPAGAPEVPGQTP
ncbi:MAG: hypothetical protein ACE5FN_01205 [Leptospirillia bacterium]